MTKSRLSPAERKALKARAHALNPIIQLGEKGLTEAVIAEIGRALDAHELIKVRAGSMERDAREATLAEICGRLDAQPVQHIGKVLVLYRQKPETSSLLLIEDARRGFEDIAAGRVQDADTAVARIQRRRAAKAKGKTTRHG